MIDWDYDKLNELTLKYKNDNNYLSIDFVFLAENFEDILKSSIDKKVRFPLLLEFELSNDTTLDDSNPSDIIHDLTDSNLDDIYYLNDVYRKAKEEDIVNSVVDVNLAYVTCFNFEVNDFLAMCPEWSSIILE